MEPGKAAEAVSEKRSQFSDSVAMEIERRQGLRLCVGLGLTVTLGTITGPVQSQCLRNSRAHTEIWRPLCSGPNSAPH